MSHALTRSASMATWEDLKAYEEGAHVEIIEGEIVVAPRPELIHGRAQSALCAFIAGPYDLNSDEESGWWIGVEPEVQLTTHNVVIPDLFGWRRRRMPTMPKGRPIRLAPDWVCEILSPSNASHDRITKADLYLRAGVQYLWLVDPDGGSIECYQASDKGWVRLGAWLGDEAPKIAPFDEVALPLKRIFPPRPAPEGEAEGGDPPR